jgi:hypothetical protein
MLGPVHVQASPCQIRKFQSQNMPTLHHPEASSCRSQPMFRPAQAQDTTFPEQTMPRPQHAESLHAQASKFPGQPCPAEIMLSTEHAHSMVSHGQTTISPCPAYCQPRKTHVKQMARPRPDQPTASAAQGRPKQWGGHGLPMSGPEQPLASPDQAEACPDQTEACPAEPMV